MDFFSIKKQKGDLFHGTYELDNFNVENRPMWFAHNEEGAKKYGTRILKFKFIKEVKLIDISHQIFHMDFMAKVNNDKSPDIDTSKFNPMIAIGLPDLNSQLKIIGHRDKGIYPNTSTDKRLLDIIEKFSPLFGNKHRFSNKTDPPSDKFMVDALQKLYPEYNGYICNNYWPSYHHGGFLIPETCIFKPLEHIELITSGGKSNKMKKKVSNKKKNGGILNKDDISPGEKPNNYGGVYFNLEDFCKETGISMDDIIKGGI